ncbi:hypothetical protein BC830DRAFT_754095 [Chytriomyces sp. MP71]|nr:hypothetical protein BC830DRAFT_754095 [Chytriomyces sp. MP71]
MFDNMELEDARDIVKALAAVSRETDATARGLASTDLACTLAASPLLLSRVLLHLNSSPRLASLKDISAQLNAAHPRNSAQRIAMNALQVQEFNANLRSICATVLTVPPVFANNLETMTGVELHTEVHTFKAISQLYFAIMFNLFEFLCEFDPQVRDVWSKFSVRILSVATESLVRERNYSAYHRKMCCICWFKSANLEHGGDYEIGEWLVHFVVRFWFNFLKVFWTLWRATRVTGKQAS